MKNFKNLLMIIALVLPLTVFAQNENHGYMLFTGDLLKQGDMVKCGTGSLIGSEYAHIYKNTENGPVSLDATSAGTVMNIKSIDQDAKKMILEDSKHNNYVCEIDYAVKNGEILVMPRAAKTIVTADNVKVIGKSASAKASVPGTINNHINNVLKTMSSNRTLTNNEMATLNRMAKR